jgi:tripartite-type tricarboxylate transporter receptor subunit TctC
MPDKVLDKLHAAAVVTLHDPELKKKFENLNAVAFPGTPEDFAAYIKAEQDKWEPVVAATGVKLD